MGGRSACRQRLGGGGDSAYLPPDDPFEDFVRLAALIDAVIAFTCALRERTRWRRIWLAASMLSTRACASIGVASRVKYFPMRGVTWMLRCSWMVIGRPYLSLTGCRCVVLYNGF